MKITICVGSSCHLKGSKHIVDQLQNLTMQHGFQNEVELCGTFCMGNCTNGVSVMIDNELFSLCPQTVKLFFDSEVLVRAKKDREEKMW